MENDDNLFNPDGHLSDEGVALWIDTAQKGKILDLPPILLSHIEGCLDCKITVVELREALDETNRVSPKEIILRKQGVVKKFLSDRKYMSLAASFLIMIIVGTLLSLFIFTRPTDPGELFTSNFKPYDDITSLRGENHPVDSTQLVEQLGFDYYNREKYDSAVLVFRHLYSLKTSSDTLAFYLANSVLATSQPPDEAIVLLKNLTTSNSVFTPQARWYLALAYLKKNKPEDAKNELQILISTSGSDRERAEKLLNQLE